MKKLYSFLLAIIIVITAARAQNPNTTTESSGTFIRNDGQLKDTDGNPRPDLKYYGNFSDRQMYYATDKISHVWYKQGDTASNAPDTLGRMDMEFVNNNTSAQIIAEQQEQGYMNFFLAHIPDGVVNVPTYEKITYQDLYTNTDMAVVKREGKVDYEITFRAGANTNNFQLNFVGATSVNLNQGTGELIVDGPLGRVEFEKPIGSIGGIGGIGAGSSPVNVEIIKIGNTVAAISITISNPQGEKDIFVKIPEKKAHPAPPSDPASIDCFLRWSTYYGGNDNSERSRRIETDDAGNIYVVGSTGSQDFPVFNAIQPVMTGNFSDVFVLKFNFNRVIEWATYYGGSNVDIGNAIAIDANKNVYFTGSTKSTDFPICTNNDLFCITTGYFQSTLQGVQNTYIVKLSSDGQDRLWATYFGLAGTNSATSIALSGQSIYLTGHILIGGQIPFPSLLPSGYVQTITGGSFDGFIAKFDQTTFAHQWSTYFGGSGGDRIFDCTVDINKNLFVVGQTSSISAIDCQPVVGKFPLCNPGGGAFVQSNHGGLDAFIAKFRADNTLVWSTQYGGSANEATPDYFSVASDLSGSVYFSGNTHSTDFPVYSSMPGAYSQPTYADLGQSDGFLVKFSNNGQLLWATCYGANYQDEIRDIAVDNFGEVYFTGMTKSKFFPIKKITGPSAYNQVIINKNNMVGKTDGFIVWLSKDLKQKWSTFYGGDDFDECFGIAVNNLTSSILVTGRTFTLQGQFPFPLKDYIPGTSYFDSNLGGQEDAFISDFTICPVKPRLAGNQYETEEEEEQEISYSGKNEIILYPNPANNTLNLQGIENAQIKIYNIFGQMVYSGIANGKLTIIDVRSFSKGMYVVQTDDGISHSIKKIIIE